MANWPILITVFIVAHFFVYAAGEIVEGRPIELDGETVHHLLNVLRVNETDRITAFDGSGTTAPCMIEIKNRKSAAVIPGKIQKFNPPAVRLHLLQGISKGPAIDSILRMAAELGVWEMHPIACANGNGGLRIDRLSQRMERWRAIAIGACRQSHNPFLPKINEPKQLDRIDFARRSLRVAAGLADGAIPLREFLGTVGENPSRGVGDIYLAVGPEGNFSDSEWQFLRQSGFIEVSLGPRVLTSETAALALVASVQLACGC